MYSEIAFGNQIMKGRAEATAAMSDAELMLLISSHERDKAAFSELVRRYSGKLFRVAWRVLYDEENCRDLVQKIFMNLWERPSWRPDGGAAPGSWLYRLTLNAAIDVKRKRVHDELPDELVDINSSGMQHVDYQHEQMIKIIKKNIDHLPKRQKEALILCYFEGLTYHKVASVMGTTSKAVESLTVRARKSLRQELEKNGIKVDDL